MCLKTPSLTKGRCNIPIYEYRCPQCELKFEDLKTIRSGRFSRCPRCNHKSYKVPSMFTHKWYNGLTTDGEGFTTKYHRPEEVKEMNAECRNR